MEIVRKNLNDLQKNPRNVRRHSERQLNEYVRSIKMFGQIRPMVIDEYGLILAGNGLYDAMIKIGIEEADCYVYSGLTTAQKDKLMLADNKVYELGITDMSVFDDIVKDLGDDLDVPGYDSELLKMVNQSTQQAIEHVMSYGKVEFEESAPEKAETNCEIVSYTSEQLNGKNPYSEAQIPQKLVVGEPENISTERKFIVCPKCGERIWL